jgi:enamine deaminase RidA (YjgF/YER057c/UK114 family)
MTKQRLMPEGHWDWSIPVPLSQGWKTGNLVFVGGQISADAEGRTIDAGDVTAQTRNVMEFIRKVLDEAGADFSDVIKINTYYCYDGPEDGLTAFLDELNAVRREYFTAPGPVTTDVGVTGLAYEGLLLEIEALAAVGVEKQHIAPPAHWNWRGGSEPYSHGWRVGDIVFVGGQISADANGALVGPGDIGVQTANVFGNIQSVLRAAGAEMGDLLRFNTCYRQPDAQHGAEVTEYWEKMTDVRMRYFTTPGASGTGVRVKSLPIPGALIQAEGIAVVDPNKQRLMPEGHWDWSIPVPFSQGWKTGNIVFCGGQISSDEKGRTVGAGDIAAQTRNVFEFIKKVLDEGGADLSDVVKLNTYYHFKGEGPDITDFWEEMTRVRLEYLPDPGPAATAVRVEGFAYEGLLIEIEAIAVIDR